MSHTVDSAQYETPFGEVIAASTVDVAGQCRRGALAPRLGELIVIESAERCVAVVSQASSTSLDSSRKPSALGLSPEEMQRRYPQMAYLIRLEFTALLVGWFHGEGFRAGLPQRPPGLHEEIRLCSEEELRLVGEQPACLRLIYNADSPAPEELLLAVCRHLLTAYGWREEEARRLGKALASIYRDDYETLRRVVERLEEWLKSNPLPSASSHPDR